MQAMGVLRRRGAREEGIPPPPAAAPGEPLPSRTVRRVSAASARCAPRNSGPVARALGHARNRRTSCLPLSLG